MLTEMKTDCGNMTGNICHFQPRVFFSILAISGNNCLRKRCLFFFLFFSEFPRDLQITYSLLSDSSGDHSLFRIDPQLGIIHTEAVFDREARSSYLLEVQSEDGQESARPGKNKQPNSGQGGHRPH